MFFITAMHAATSIPLPSHHAISQLPNSPEDTKQATIGYTRYGKAPPWYAPGRICTFDLTGNMIDLQSSLDTKGEVGVLDSISTKLPNVVEWLIDRCAPSF
jgi:hypothetical protein